MPAQTCIRGTNSSHLQCRPRRHVVAAQLPGAAGGRLAHQSDAWGVQPHALLEHRRGIREVCLCAAGMAGGWATTRGRGTARVLQHAPLALAAPGREQAENRLRTARASRSGQHVHCRSALPSSVPTYSVRAPQPTSTSSSVGTRSRPKASISASSLSSLSARNQFANCDQMGARAQGVVHCRNYWNGIAEKHGASLGAKFSHQRLPGLRASR